MKTKVPTKTTSLTNHKIEKQLNILGKNWPEIISIYIYGSFLYSPKKYNDLDILVVLKENKNPFDLLTSLDSQIRRDLPGMHLDTNYVFENELKLSVSGEKSAFYYLYVSKKGLLIYGLPILENIKPDAFDVYLRAIRLIHRARHFYYNQKEVEFWSKKFKKWLLYALAETYFCQHHVFDANLKITAKQFITENPEFSEANTLFGVDAPKPSVYLSILEKLRLFIERSFYLTIKQRRQH